MAEFMGMGNDEHWAFAEKRWWEWIVWVAQLLSEHEMPQKQTNLYDFMVDFDSTCLYTSPPPLSRL